MVLGPKDTDGVDGATPSRVEYDWVKAKMSTIWKESSKILYLTHEAYKVQ